MQGVSYSQKFHGKCSFPNFVNTSTSQYLWFTNTELDYKNVKIDSEIKSFWTPGRADRGLINLVPSVCPYHSSVRLRQAFLEKASFNFSETWHEVRVP